MVGLTVLLTFDPDFHALRWGALGYSAIGLSFSIYFMYLQANFIHAFCIYCLISGLTTLLLFSAAFAHFRMKTQV